MQHLKAGMSRRALLFTPFALAGLAAFWLRKERALPNPAAGGLGPAVTVILFSSKGERIASATVKQVVKTDAEWQSELTHEEYLVTRKSGTERAYTGKYWNTRQTGVYRCVCCGNALFRSAEKFDSDTGWPCFWAPIAPENIFIQKDKSISEERVEVACKECGSHLGHVFNDGPPPTGLRYCLNSAALRLITPY